MIVVGRDSQIGIGVANPYHIAYLDLYGDCGIYADAPDSPMLATLRKLIGEWDASGRPVINTFKATLTPTIIGWDVRAHPPG